MELMATSLDKFYKFVYGTSDDVIPEEILGKITLAVSLLFLCVFFFSLNFIRRPLVTSVFFSRQTVKALNHLKENLKIIHRGKQTPAVLDSAVCASLSSMRLSALPLSAQTSSRPTSSWTGTAT